MNIPGSDAKRFIYAPIEASVSNITAIYALFNEGNTYRRRPSLIFELSADTIEVIELVFCERKAKS